MDNLTDLRVLNDQIQELRTRRAGRLAELAAAEVLSVCPQALLVTLEGPQEPGSTARILRLLASDGKVIYDWMDETTADHLAGGLSAAQDYLTAALEDDAQVFMLRPDGTYVLLVLQ